MTPGLLQFGWNGDNRSSQTAYENPIPRKAPLGFAGLSSVCFIINVAKFSCTWDFTGTTDGKCTLGKVFDCRSFKPLTVRKVLQIIQLFFRSCSEGLISLPQHHFISSIFTCFQLTLPRQQENSLGSCYRNTQWRQGEIGAAEPKDTVKIEGDFNSHSVNIISL